MSTTVIAPEANGATEGPRNTGSGAAGLVQVIGTLGAMTRAIIVLASDEALRRLSFGRIMRLLVTGRLGMTLTQVAEILLHGRTLIEQLKRMGTVTLTSGTSSSLALALAVEFEEIAGMLKADDPL